MKNNSKILIKVCGMKDPMNLKEFVVIKPDFIGFIFHEKSPRNISCLPDVNIPNSIKKVGVFVDKKLDFIEQKVKEFQLDFIQLHGSESAIFCKHTKEKGYKIIKAFNIQQSFDFNKLKEYEPFCEYFLFDAFGKNKGGNGITFNWDLLQKYQGNIPFLLSGGINKTMHKKINKITHPKFIGIDINSGFELKPGLKNTNEIKHFLHEIQS